MNAIMIHIPRTGGGSIEMAYHRESWFQDLTYNPRAFLRKNKLNTNAKLIHMGHHLPSMLKKTASDDWVDRCYKFAFVRNPWDRVVSLFFYLRQFRKGTCEWPNSLLLDFPSFVREITKPDSPTYKIRPAGKSFWYALPQTHWLIPDLNFVGKFENLDTDWARICEEINLSCKKLPMHNPSEHLHYASYYDDETQIMVADRYADEIERFGYEFQ